MEVENQQHFEVEENLKQLDTSEETEDGLMEQRGDDALEHQDDWLGNQGDKEIVNAGGSLEMAGNMTGHENRGVVPADLETKVHVPKEEGCSEKKDEEHTSDQEQEDDDEEIEDKAGDRKQAELELLVHEPKQEGSIETEQDEQQDEVDDDEKVTDLDVDKDADNVPDIPKHGRVAAELELLVQDPDNDAEKISANPKEPEYQEVPADLELNVQKTETDNKTPELGGEPAETELLVQKDENDNDNDVQSPEIQKSGDVKTQEKQETKAKPKAGSVKNSIAKFNNTQTKKDKGMFITVQPDKCSACEKTVYAMEKLEMNKNIYHRGCFKCSHCSATLTAKTFSINEGVIYCTTHFKQLFARKGNYDEGFGRQQYKKKWVEEQLKNKDTTA